MAAIVAGARATVDARRARESLTALERRADAAKPRGHLFRDALVRPGHTNVVAECKRRSPARGVLTQAYDPVALASAYERGGAAAVSVLTEPSFFDGDLAHLRAVRDQVSLPLLRKDFIIDEYQLVEARAAGADAVLLIVAALDRGRLSMLQARADRLGLATLVEVHTAEELVRAVDAGASIIGVNSRNLKTLEVDLAVCESLAARIPPACAAVAESGLHSRNDLRRLQGMGYQAFLIGEWLASAADPAALLQSLVEPDPVHEATGPDEP
ncbi:MAG: indole-3-glycerol phosphate synthase TrpC [Acidobacteriota bacterium]